LIQSVLISPYIYAYILDEHSLVSNFKFYNSTISFGSVIHSSSKVTRPPSALTYRKKEGVMQEMPLGAAGKCHYSVKV
jgi:hypothetical protein